MSPMDRNIVSDNDDENIFSVLFIFCISMYVYFLVLNVAFRIFEVALYF